MEARNERADSSWKPPVPDVFSQKKYKAHERGVESFVVGVARSGNSGRRTARAAEGNICDQFLAPEGDLDVPSGFAKNGNTLNQPQNLLSYSASSLFDLATAYAERIVKNHPFVDGNKRTAYVAMVLFLKLNGYQLIASKEERVIIFIQLASGSITTLDFTKWLEENTQLE